MSKLVSPHGSAELKCLLLEGEARAAEIKRAQTMKKVPMTSRETGDLIMMGIGAFTPLDGFMGKEDWRGVCESYSHAEQEQFVLAHSDYSVGHGRDTRSLLPSAKRWRCGIPKPESIMGNHESDREIRNRQGITSASRCSAPRTRHTRAYRRLWNRARQSGRSREGGLGILTTPRCSRGSISVRPKRASRLKSVAGPRWRPCSFATRCTIPMPIWRGLPSRFATASTSTNWWAS